MTYTTMKSENTEPGLSYGLTAGHLINEINKVKLWDMLRKQHSIIWKWLNNFYQEVSYTGNKADIYFNL